MTAPFTMPSEEDLIQIQRDMQRLMGAEAKKDVSDAHVKMQEALSSLQKELRKSPAARCKFLCTEARMNVSIIDNVPYSVNVALTPVFGDSPENKTFWEATPAGSLSMCITNPELFGFFHVSKSYYLDITEAK